MKQVTFNGHIKEVSHKSLVSGDYSTKIEIQLDKVTATQRHAIDEIQHTKQNMQGLITFAIVCGKK